MSTIEQSEAVEAPVNITPRAAERVFAFAEGAAFLRVAVQGGGCGGFQYALNIEEGPAADDLVLSTPHDEVTMIVDPFSLPYLQGSVVDFVEGMSLGESGFKIDNPNAVASCGCGNSFRVDDDSCS